MTPTIVALVKVAIAALAIYGICKLEAHLETKIHETAGTRTDVLIMTSMLSVVGLMIFIVFQLWILVSPVFTLIFSA